MKQINRAINKLEVLSTLVQETLQEIKSQQSTEEVAVESPSNSVPSNVVPLHNSNLPPHPQSKQVQQGFGKPMVVPVKTSYSPAEQSMITLSSIAVAVQAASQFMKTVKEADRSPLLEALLSEIADPGDDRIRQDVLAVSEFGDLLELAMRKVCNIPDPLIN